MTLPIKIEGIIFARGEDGKLKFFLMKRVSGDGGFWQPLTESLEDGESVQACLKRGLEEELGLFKPISVTDKIWSFAWENKKGEPHIDLVYGVEISKEATIKLNPQEHSESRWCSFPEAVKLLGKENNKEAFRRFKKKISL